MVVETEVHYAIDFDYLTSLYPNSVAWLYQPNTDINLPVMYNPDDPAYYLRRQFNDRISANGGIFTKGDAATDFAGNVITIYGRNCLDDAMFGAFSHYSDPEHANYYPNNPVFYLVTPDGNYQLDVFACIKTKLSDKTTWRVPQEDGSAQLMDYLPDILEKSLFKPIASSLPIEGDDWALLATTSTEDEGSRYVVYARKRPIIYQTENVVYLNKMEMDTRETLNGYVTAENVGTWMSYAQNDPLWDKLMFEAFGSKKRRVLGDGGCGPTAIATAIANLVDKEELPKLRDYAESSYGFRFCSCSVNDYYCLVDHISYQLITPDEYLRYFPVAVANFSTGNNKWDIKGRYNRFGSNMSYLEQICSIYDISVTKTNQLPEAIEFLQNKKGMIIACTSGYGSPFTQTSHFLVLAGADDEYVYVLDTLRRTSYDKWDRNDYVEIIVPGLVRVKLDDAARCNLAPMYLLEKTEK